MDFEDLLTALDVGKVDVDLPVKTAGTKQSTVEDVGTVGRRHDDDSLVGIEAVHLDEDLVEGLFTFVVSATEACSTLTAHGIDLIDEDDAGLIAFCNVEEVTDSRGTDTDVHLDEVRSAHRIERHTRLACNGLCEERFTRSGRADEQHALGDTGTEIGELLGALEELDDFGELFLFFLGTGDVRETDFDIRGDLGLGLAEAHRLGTSAHRRTHHKEDGDDANDEHCKIDDGRPVRTRVWV